MPTWVSLLNLEKDEEGWGGEGSKVWLCSLLRASPERAQIPPAAGPGSPSWELRVLLAKIPALLGEDAAGRQKVMGDSQPRPFSLGGSFTAA